MTRCEQCGKPMQDILEYVEHILHECSEQITEFKSEEYKAYGYEGVREQL
ncbi:hypothetical protein SAMN05720606_110119 [Paenibacillus polysaccharolyticus]|uniref:Uncharacterized protein n=1 Tax=Paenibacillus polysaccharolyticus TaxID=582692 RepID=A0A1G5J7R6_9BACL|nr:hypothetical protein [Paenibacillus polysaccharolyticus]SCY84254.1 hypothetical protein SAMN05720606_110119 [Paenibacillus polysaccharolyticus]